MQHKHWSFVSIPTYTNAIYVCCVDNWTVYSSQQHWQWIFIWSSLNMVLSSWMHALYMLKHLGIYWIVLFFSMILFLRGGNNGIIFTWISNEKTKCLISQISCHQSRHLLKLADALPLSTNSFLIMTIKWRGQGNGCWHFPCSMKKIYIKSKKLQFVWSVTEQYMNELSDWICIAKPYTVFMQYTK